MPSPPNFVDLYLGSLAALGFDPLTHDIRLVEESFGTGEKFVQEREIPVMEKLRRVGLKKSK